MHYNQKAHHVRQTSGVCCDSRCAFSVFDISFPVSPKAFWETASLTILSHLRFQPCRIQQSGRAEQNSFFHLGNISDDRYFTGRLSTACTKNCIKVVASLELISPSPSQSIADFCTSFTSTLPLTALLSKTASVISTLPSRFTSPHSGVASK